MADQIEVYKGDDWSIPFQYTQDGDPFDLTGYPEFKACFKGEDGTPVEVTLTGGEIVLDNALAGKVIVNVPKAKSALVKKGDIDFVIIRTDPSANEVTNKIVELLLVDDRGC